MTSWTYLPATVFQKPLSEPSPIEADWASRDCRQNLDITVSGREFALAYTEHEKVGFVERMWAEGLRPASAHKAWSSPTRASLLMFTRKWSA